MLSAAQLLDELMGRDRNLGPQDKREDINWADSEVCKHFLVRFCPHELFTNTKADLGPCEKLHDERIRDAYKRSPKFEKMGYEEDFVQFSQNMIGDVERRIKRGRQRLSLTQQENAQVKVQDSDNDEKITLLTEKINSLLEQVETLGCEGKVEEAQDVMKLCDQMKEDRETLRKGGDPAQGANANVVEKQMEVCEVCGAFLIVGDAQQRLDDHLMGKQHSGYAMLRTTLEEVSAACTRRKEERERQRVNEDRRQNRYDEPKVMRNNNDRRGRQFRNDSRRRSPDRNHQRFDRYSQDRRRKGSDRRWGRRSRSRDRRSRSRSNDRKRRSRSRDNRRSKNDSRRSRSRDNRRRSRSGDRRQSQSRDEKRSKSREKRSNSRSRSDDSGKDEVFRNGEKHAEAASFDKQGD